MDSWEERLGTAIEHACENLPKGSVLNLALENGGYGINLIVNHKSVPVECSESIIDEIEIAVATAIEATNRG